MEIVSTQMRMSRAHFFRESDTITRIWERLKREQKSGKTLWWIKHGTQCALVGGCRHGAAVGGV